MHFHVSKAERPLAPTAVAALLLSLQLTFAACGPRAASEELTARRMIEARQTLGGLPAAAENFRAGRYEEAEKAFRSLRQALPGPRHAASAAALLGLQGPQAYRRLLSGLETNLGLSQLRMRRYQEAADSLRQAVATDPASAPAKANLGIALIHLRRYDEAARTLGEAVRRGADNERTLLHLGQAALGTGDLPRARWALNRALRQGSRTGSLAAWGVGLEARQLLAEVELATGSPERAREVLEGVLADAPGDPQPRYRLMQILGRLAEDEALAHHRRIFDRDSATVASIQGALAANPGDVAGRHWIADTYARLGLDHLAEAHYLQLLTRYPQDEAARSGLLDLRRRHAARKSRG